MIDTRSPRVPLTVQLPADLIGELGTLAREKQAPLDDVVLEACLEYAESHGWERDFKEWQQRHSTGTTQGLGSDGAALDPTAPVEKRS